MEIKELTNAEFKEFSKMFSPSSIYQTVPYAFTMNEEGCDSVFLGLVDNNVLKAATLIIIGKVSGFKYAFVPRGFLIDFNNKDLIENFTKEIKKYLSHLGICALKISPSIIRNIYDNKGNLISKNNNYDNTFELLTKLKYFHMGYNDFFEALKPRYEAIINLDLPYTSLFANIEKPFRTKIRKAENDGIKIYHGNENNLEYLYLQTKEKYPRDLKYFQCLYKFFSQDNLIDFYYSKLDTTEYLKITQNLYALYEKKSKDLNNALIGKKGDINKIMNEKIEVDKTFEKYKAQLVIATKYLKEHPEGIILSSALVIKWQDTVYLIIDGYDENYKSFNAKHLLLWKLMGRYSKLGYKKFNLGGVTNIHKESKEYAGLNEFKLNFNAKVIEYIGDFELITNSPLYFMYRKSKGFNNMIMPGGNK